MFIRTLIVSLGLSCSCVVWSFPCYYTLVKDSCWTKYNVSVDVIDPVTSSKLLTVTVPSGKSWVRETFDCHAAQGLIYIAKFNPVFWKNDAGKTYQGLRNWFLPGAINPGDTAWTIPVCYPKDFSEVPLPPEADGNCKCDFSVIPPVEPK
ncbi:hypothetical protein [Legionella antarctica]|uniref:hypothetical protein n=1 Tax=Legionella antarctica TaxID=2708020 RepID=UPI0015650930|nr:hypothetical protein [Legionella antarctica]